MDRKVGLAAALAALMLAAGINSADALDTLSAGEPDRQRIEALTSVHDLQLELAALRALDPEHPLIAVTLGRIIALSQPPAPATAARAPDLAPY